VSIGVEYALDHKGDRENVGEQVCRKAAMVADLLQGKKALARLMERIVQTMGGYQQFGHLVAVQHGGIIGARPTLR
jgi:hypothetical protein